MRDAARLHAAQQHDQRHIAQRSANLVWGREEICAPMLRRSDFADLRKNLQSAIRKGDAMFLAHFHPLGRYLPNSVFDIDLGPRRLKAFIRAAGRQDNEFER